MAITYFGNQPGGNDAKDNAVVHLTGNETVAGTKTFTTSPVVPTPITGDNSTKAASTAFVASTLATLPGANLNNAENLFTDPLLLSGISAWSAPGVPVSILTDATNGNQLFITTTGTNNNDIEFDGLAVAATSADIFYIQYDCREDPTNTVSSTMDVNVGFTGKDAGGHDNTSDWPSVDGQSALHSAGKGNWTTISGYTSPAQSTTKSVKLRVSVGNTPVASGQKYYFRNIVVRRVTTPLAPANDNSAKPASTAWVASQNSGVVHTSGDETISGTKTFTGTVNTQSADGAGLNIKIGNDAYIGDGNVSNGVLISGQAISAAGYIKLGTTGPTIGWDTVHLTGLKNLIDPTDPQDAVTKEYVDNAISNALQGVSKVKIATGTITISGGNVGTVTFPSSLFTSNPMVSAWVANYNNTYTSAILISNVTTSGCTIYPQDPSSISVAWMAVQN